MNPVILVITNLPDREAAETLARVILGERLAACVNILAPCRSIYTWQGSLEEADEVPVFIKTTVDCYERLESVIRDHHPYSVPEIVATPVTAGLPAYLQWVVDETRRPTAA